MDIQSIIQQMTLEEKAAMCSGKNFFLTKPVERLGVPSVQMSDGPHGLRKQDGKSGDHLGIGESIKAVCFPAGCALAASFDVSLAERIGRTLGNECRAENVALLLGPAVNIKRSPLCGRNFEYLSEDPYLAGKMGAAVVRGMQSEGIGACIKHFAVNNQETRRMTSDSVVDERTLHEIYLSVFETIVKEAHPWSVMVAYNRINGTFCVENRTLLTEILRKKWGFDGFTVTDWGAVKDPVKGVAAGLDLVMPGGNDVFARHLVSAVQKGELREEQLDLAVENVLKFVEKYTENGMAPAGFDREKDYRTAVEAAKECAVLLKNEGVLPLNRAQKVAFIGEYAKKPRSQGGGSSHINSAKCVSAWEAAEGANAEFAQGFSEKGDGEALLREAVVLAAASDAAVLFVGTEEETEGVDREDISLPAEQERLIRAVAEVQKNTVVVLHNGSAVAMPWIDEVSAVLEMYLAGDGTGEAEVSLLYGDAVPCGKLAESFPLRLSDTPCYLNFPGEGNRTEYREGIFVGYRYYDKCEKQVLFPFGHGLSYTTFEYGDMKMSADKVRGGETLRVSCTVKNTGTRSGKEIVQLYVSDAESTVMRPVRELKGFTKVELAPGEKKRVEFLLDKRTFAYYEPRVHDFVIETGLFKISIGASSRDICLTRSVSVQSEDELRFPFDRNSTMGDLSRDPAGQHIMQAMRERMAKKDTGAAEQALGQEASKMVQKMKEEMPIGYLVSMMGIPEEVIDGILAQVNATIPAAEEAK